MSGFHFPQYEHELFWRYYDRLHAFLAHCDYCLEKWELLDIVYEGVNCETRAPLEQWDFCAKSVDEACDFLDWLAWDMYEFETSCSDFTSHPLASPLMYLLYVKFVIIRIITAVVVLIIFLMKVLLDLVI